MAGNSTACFVPVCSLKVIIGRDSFLYGAHTFIGDGSTGYEERTLVHIIAAGEAILDIVRQALCVVTSVFLDYGHFAVFDFDAGFQVQ